MWITSKLNRPDRLHNAINRPRVLTLLQDAAYCKLILFRSPAGYGKTTMAAQWLSSKDHVGWFNIDEDDNDTFHFANYFIQAINKVTDQACLNSQAIAEKRQFSSLSNLFSELFAELSLYSKELYLVLDDYHLIHNNEIHEGIRFFLKYMPKNCTLVVTSRTHPPLNTANLRVRDLLIEIDHEALAFDDEEIVHFFQERLGQDIDQETVDRLQAHIEGWPSALQLLALQIKQKKLSLAQSTELISQFNHAHLWDYLAEEVFDLLDEQTQLFLMQCSIFKNFNVALLKDLLKNEDTLNILESLHRFGLFIYTIEDEQNWYRFQNLFAEFLSHQRQTQIPQQECQLHRDAARAWLNQHNPQQALNHARKAKDNELTATILTEFGWKMFNHGELDVLESAITSLDGDTLFSHPKLSLLRAWLAQSQHRFNQVDKLLIEAQAEMDKRGIVLDESLQGELNALRGQVAINQNQPELALKLAVKALEQLEADTYRSRIVATSVIGEVNHVLGHLDRALPMMQQTERMARQYHMYHQALWALLQQSEILMAQGHVQAAYDIQDSAFKLIEAQHFQQLPLHEFLLRIRSKILWAWNHLDEAEQTAHKGLKVLVHYDETMSLHSYSMLAKISVCRGELDKASHYINQCSELINQSQYHIDWTANASFAQLIYWQARGAMEEIQNWLRIAVEPEDACNHFQQLQWRNFVRAYILTEQYSAATDLITMLKEKCDSHGLVSDKQRCLILEAVLYAKLDNQTLAMDSLNSALELSNSTGIITNFLLEGKTITPLLKKLLEHKLLGEMERYRAEKLLKEMTTKEHTRAVNFDKAFIKKIVSNESVPELIRTSPLTHREWQVLGLIYSRYSNEQIASELDVASTTIKTHIRNLYQKLNIANRQEAIETAENLLKMIGY